MVLVQLGSKMEKTKVIGQLVENGSMSFRQLLESTGIEKNKLEKAIAELLIGNDIYKGTNGKEAVYEL